MKLKNIGLVVGLFVATPVLAGSTTDAAIGGAVGGGLGAAVGNELGGRQGAIIGGGLGGATGAAITTKGSSDGRSHVIEQRVDDDYDHHHKSSHSKKKHHSHDHDSSFCPPGQAKKGRC